MLLLNSWRVSSHIVRYDTNLQLFKNSTDTQEKLRFNLHSLSVKPVFHLRIFSREANFSFVFVSQLEPSGTNWIKTKENFALRAKKFASAKPA